MKSAEELAKEIAEKIVYEISHNDPQDVVYHEEVQAISKIVVEAILAERKALADKEAEIKDLKDERIMTEKNFEEYADSAIEEKYSLQFKLKAQAKVLERMREALRLAVDIADSWIYDQLDGTGQLEDARRELAPAKEALSLPASAAEEEVRLLNECVTALERIKEFHVQEDHDLPEEEMRDIASKALSALEAFRKGGKS